MKIATLDCDGGGGEMIHEQGIEYVTLMLWLADCQAGTTEHLQSLKSASKSEVRRHRHICEGLVRAIEQGNYSGIRCRKPEKVLERLRGKFLNSVIKPGFKYARIEEEKAEDVPAES